MDKNVKIKFLATADGLNKIFKDVQKITNSNNINLTENLSKDFKQAEVALKALLTRAKQMSEQEDFSLFDMEQLEEDSKKAINKISKIINSLSFSGVSEKFKKELEKIEQEIENKKSSKNSLQKDNRNISKRIGHDTETGLSSVKENQAFKQAAGKTNNNVADLSYKDTQIASYEQLAKVIKEINTLTKEEKTQYQELINIYNQATSSLNAQVETEKNKIAANNESIATIDKEIQKLQEKEGAIKKQSATSSEQVNYIDQLSNAQAQLNSVEGQQEKIIDNVVTEERKNAKAKKDSADATSKTTIEINTNTDAYKKNTTTIGKAAKQVFTYGTILSIFRRIYSTVTSTVKGLDKALTDMAVVTSMSREDAYKLTGQFNELAAATGKTTTEIANMATKFYQQGKSTTQVLKLTEAAAKAATIAGIDGSKSIDLLTNALNGFQMSASQAMEVSDKFAALAASAATNYEELATALSKVAAQANLAGISMDFTLGLLTKGIETTREAPETIGTALKTVISRMRELTDYGKTLEDGVDVNRVDKALQNVGISLMDTNGQFRDLELVLTELGQKWDTLNTNQQANVAVALAGTRQQSRLIAMMQDFDRTLELVDISASSYGATMAQSADYMEGLEAAQTRLKNSMEGLVNSIVKTDWFIGVLDILTSIVGVVEYILSKWYLYIPVMLLIGGNLLKMLDTKLKISAAEKSILKQQLEQQKNNKQQQLILVKLKKSLLQKLKTEQKVEEQTEEVYLNKLKEAKLTAETNGDLAKAAQYEALIRQETQDDVEEKQEQWNLTKEIAAVEAEEKLLKGEISVLDQQILASSGAMPNILNSIISGVTGWVSLLSLVAPIWKLILKLQDWSIKKTKKQTAEETKAAIATSAKAGAEAAGNAAKNIPWAGIGIALAILAAVAVVTGLAIAGIGIASANSGKKTEDSIAKTKEELNQLQADLYNLNQAQQNVRKLGDEFDTLSSKIIKTEEEIERLNEISQQINDEAGRTVVNQFADYETQLAQIRGYEAGLKIQVQNKVKEINKTLSEGLTDAKDSAVWWFFRNSEKEAKAEQTYRDTLITDDAFISSARTVAMSQISGMDEVSTNTQDLILDMFVDALGNIANDNSSINWGDELFSENGIDTSVFEERIGGKAFIKSLDETLKKGTIQDYISQWKTLNDTQKQLLQNSNPIFSALSKIGTAAMESFAKVGYTAEEINIISSAITEQQKVLGTEDDKSKDLSKMLFEIKAGDDSIKHRRKLYKQLVEQQMKAQAASAQYATMSEEELLSLAKSTDVAAKKYQELATATANLTAKQADLDKAKDVGSNTSDAEQEAIDKAQKEYDDASVAVGRAQEEWDAFIDTANNSTQAIEEFNKILGIVSIDEVVEDMTKLNSAMNRIQESIGNVNLSLKEQIELLSDYPQLLNAMERGYLTMSEAVEFSEEQLEKSYTTIKNNMDSMSYKYREGVASTAIAESAKWGEYTKLFENTEEGAAARKAFLDNYSSFNLETEANDPNSWFNQFYRANIEKQVENLWNGGKTTQQIQKEDGTWRKMTKNEIRDQVEKSYTTVTAQENIAAIVADIEAYDKNALALGKSTNITSLLSEKEQEAANKAADANARNRARIEELNQSLENLDTESEEYKAALKERNKLELDSINANNEQLKSIQEQTNEILDYTFDFGGKASDYIDFIDGEAFLNQSKLSELTTDQQTEVKNKLSVVLTQLNGFAAKTKELTDQIEDSQKVLGETFIAQQTKILEKNIAALEKEKEALEEQIEIQEELKSKYEETWNALDALEEEKEREKSSNDIIRQLSALEGGSDSATNSLRKDLMQQLQDLQEEEREAEKQEARDALTESIDKNIAMLEDDITKKDGIIAQQEAIKDTVENGINKILTALYAGSEKTRISQDQETGEIKLEVYIENEDKWVDYSFEDSLPHNANGGLVDYTGPTWVDGTPSKPEAFLSADDTKNMELLLNALQANLDSSIKTSVDNNDISENTQVSVSIGQVDIHTDELNNNQDFADASNIFATEFANAIQRRGLNLNVKK